MSFILGEYYGILVDFFKGEDVIGNFIVLPIEHYFAAPPFEASYETAVLAYYGHYTGILIGPLAVQSPSRRRRIFFGYYAIFFFDGVPVVREEWFPAV
jgi:hypothetical protein